MRGNGVVGAMEGYTGLRPDREVLDGLKVLIVEDQFLLADELSLLIEQYGAKVIGPAGTVASALRLLGEHSPDIALLDVNLGAERVYPVADELLRTGVPFVFMTGYDSDAVDERFSVHPLVEKPVHARLVIQTLSNVSASH
jgi:two-component SAPR family response regulator